MSDIKQVIVMRKDLNMRKGKMVAQGAHAAMMFLLVNGSGAEPVWYTRINSTDAVWMNGSFTKVCVGVDSLEELRRIYLAAYEHGFINHVHMVVDNGKTEFGGVPTPTCLAIGPDRSEHIDQITGHLKLL